MNKPRPVQLSPAWLELLGDLFSQAPMQQLSAYLRSQKQQGKIIYPKGCDILAAFGAFAPQDTKVIILGQDPYHGEGQACGLCFAVPQGKALPPSLINIYKELASDLPDSPTAQNMASGVADGQLWRWAQQGVLLLNSVLTVEDGKAASHAGKGWEEFTDQVILRLAHMQAQRGRHLVFLLWGSYAQKKAACIDKSQHLLLASTHPSPLSAHRGFFGSRPFSRCNAYLQQHGMQAISW